VIVFIAPLLSYDLRSERNLTTPVSETFWGWRRSPFAADAEHWDLLLGHGHQAMKSGTWSPCSAPEQIHCVSRRSTCLSRYRFSAGKGYGHEASQSFLKMLLILWFGRKSWRQAPACAAFT